MIQGVSPDLPHTDRLPVPREWGLRLAAPLVRIVMRLSWRVTVHGAQHVPSSGPVILAANHIGLLDGPALVALTRRLTFAMVKREAFSGPVGQFLTHVGQISLNRREIDPQAIRRAIQVLRAGKVLGVFPEGVRGSGEVASGEGRCGLLGDGLGGADCPGRNPGHPRTRPEQEPATSLAETDPRRLRRAVHRAPIFMAAAQVRCREVDRGRPGTSGRSRGRRAGADRATLAGATEDQNRPAHRLIKSSQQAHESEAKRI